MPEITVSFRFVTEFGRTQRQESVTYDIADGEAVEWQPKNYPPGVKAWIPMFISSNPGDWAELAPQQPGQTMTLQTNDPALINQPVYTSTTYPQQTRSTGVNPDGSFSPAPAVDSLYGIIPPADNSGIDGPGSALGQCIAFGQILPAPGFYEYAVSQNFLDPDDGRESETPPSPSAYITVPAGYYTGVSSPVEYGNYFANGEGTILGNNGVPYGWTWFPSSGLSISSPFGLLTSGIQTAVDTSNAANAVDVIATPSVPISIRPYGTFRCVIDIENYVSGEVDVVLEVTKADLTTVRTIMETISGNGSHEVIFTTGEVASPSVDYEWPLNILWANVYIRHVGNRGHGTRRLTSKLKHTGGFVGNPGLFPLKRYHETFETGVMVSSVEDPTRTYPTSGYTVVVKNPSNQHRPILNGVPGTYVPGNMLEYYGPLGTPLTSTYPMSGMKCPVKPGETRTYSLHFFWRGVSEASPGTPLRAVLKNRAGVVIADLGAFSGVSGVSLSSSLQAGADANGYVRRKLTATIPLNSDAAYIEFVAGGLGDGLWRIMGFQEELGSDMTAFTTAHATSGSLISSFDMAIPGVPHGSFNKYAESQVKRFIALGAIVTPAAANPASSSYIVEARSVSAVGGTPSEWTSNIASVPINDVLEIRTQLFTSDINLTPHLSAHYCDFERDIGSPAYGILCRSDGTEFDGGVIVFDFPPINPRNPILEEEYADHSHGFAVMGKKSKWAEGWGAEFYLNSAAEEFMSSIGEDILLPQHTTQVLAPYASTYIVEFAGWRYRVRILKATVLPTDRATYQAVDGLDSGDGKWILQATSISAEVLEATKKTS